MLRRVEWLKPLPDNDDSDVADLWNTLVAQQTADLHSLLTDAYFYVFEMYQMTQYSVPYAALNRNLARRWAAITKQMGMPKSTLLIKAMRGASESGSIPLTVTLGFNGGWRLIPTEIIDLCWAYAEKAGDDMPDKPDPLYVPLTSYDVEAVKGGREQGPLPTPKMLPRMRAPFEPKPTEPQPLTHSQTDTSDEIRRFVD